MALQRRRMLCANFVIVRGLVSELILHPEKHGLAKEYENGEKPGEGGITPSG